MTSLAIVGIAKRRANHGIVDAVIPAGSIASLDSNHLSLSSSLVKHPQGLPKDISVVTSMVKNAALRAKSKGLYSEEVEIYFLLMRSIKDSTCLSTVASRSSMSFPEY